MRTLLFISLLLLVVVGPVNAIELKNEDALAGLTTTRVIFDINQGNPSRLLLRLEFIEKTYQQLKTFGTTPELVLAFRGPASRFVTTGESYVPHEDRKEKQKVEEWIKHFSQLGMKLEQCALAAELQKIATSDFLPQIKVVANGYISLIGYQNQGYAFVPMD